MTTLQLWVSALGTERTGWTRVGTSPYLNAQDQPTHYVYSIVKKAEIGDFDFQDTAETGTINSVTLYVYGQTAIANNLFYIWNGITWASYNPILPATWGWASIAVPVLDTWNKINGAKLYIYHPNSTSRTDIDAAYLLVDYTPPPPTGWRQLQYFTEPQSAGWNKLRYASEPPVPGAWNRLLYAGE